MVETVTLPYKRADCGPTQNIITKEPTTATYINVAWFNESINNVELNILVEVIAPGLFMRSLYVLCLLNNKVFTKYIEYSSLLCSN